MRTLTAGAVVALNSNAVPLILLLELGFTPKVLANSSAVDVDWNGQTFLRTGNLGAVDPVRDTGGELSGLKFTISGVPSENISLALSQSARGKTCKMWCAVLNAVTHAVEDAPLIFSGELDQMPISQQGSSCTIGVTAIHMGTLFRRPRTLLQTESAQELLYSGDTSRRFLISQANHKDVWPAASFGRQ